MNIIMPMPKLTDFWEIFKIIIVAAIIVVPIRFFLFQPFLVRGASMEPSFQNNDYLFADELSYRFLEPKRGETIIFKPLAEFSPPFIKRIIGLPGEEIEIKDGQIIITKNGKEQILDESSYLSQNTYTLGNFKISLKENEYFVLGDNRLNSADSRVFGPLPRENIIGRVFLRVFPFANLTKIEAPAY